jgi:hypothetical protein
MQHAGVSAGVGFRELSGQEDLAHVRNRSHVCCVAAVTGVATEAGPTTLAADK